MKSEKISVRGTSPVDAVVVGASFSADMPTTLAEAAEVYGEEQAMACLLSGATIYLQSAVRKRIVEAWEELPQSERDLLIVQPEKEGGTITATLNADAMTEIQEFINEWKPGTRAARRTREVNPIALIASKWASFTDEEKANLRELLASLG